MSHHKSMQANSRNVSDHHSAKTLHALSSSIEADLIQRILKNTNPKTLSVGEISYLQRTIGNQATRELIATGEKDEVSNDQHGRGCACLVCRPPMIAQSAKIQAKRETDSQPEESGGVAPARATISVQIGNSPDTKSSTADSGKIQRVKADLYAGAGNLSHVSSGGDKVGNSVSAALNHAERLAWNDGKADVRKKIRNSQPNEQVTVLFDLDKGICATCQIWFENEVLGTLSQWDAQLNKTTPTLLQVEVNRKKRDVVKGQTDWSGISYAKSIRDMDKKEFKQTKKAAYGIA